MPAYVVAQVVAGLVAGAALFAIALRQDGFTATGHTAPPTGMARTPRRLRLGAALLAELILTAVFLCVILGATDRRAPRPASPRSPSGADPDPPFLHPDHQHLVNLARSTGVARQRRQRAPGQLWLFWVAPILGAMIAGATYAAITGEKTAPAAA